ncbi:toll-like receptor 5 [Boleophthalmus pectinirostris]|uniref:toll-like receptor 5 n=1 Tax=Boleophthalmus pectinirostris TaxID=150288 RepID=UPI000A1C4CB8|nr:toll-like receptor 5 [Boleophthalmus pectinirostris]
MKMWRLSLQMAMICTVLQLQSCSSCIITGPVAFCAFKNLSSVPELPPHITHLFLEMNRIHEITATSLSQLPMLQHLDLGHQNVPLVIRNNAFSKQTNLTRLVLSSNRNLQLEPSAFVGLSNLKLLYLEYCNLNKTILNSAVLEPLTSLETLDLFGNKIKRLQPAMHFTNMTNLKNLNLKLNSLDRICEADMAGFKGKNFGHVNLNSVQLRTMSSEDFDWEKCGNPFKNMSFEFIDFSDNYMNLSSLKQFFKAIQGTKINKLKLSGRYGRGFSFNNLPDPDNTTFEGLRDSHLQQLDMSTNWIFALKHGVFSPFKGIQMLDISQNNVNQIDINAFDGLQTSLQSLNLSHNLLGELYSYTFAVLTNLKVLDLSHNHIGVLGYQSFRGLTNLQALFLTGNAIANLGFPASLPKLQILKLDDNKLKSTYNIAHFAGSTKYLDVSSNKLTNLGDVYMFLSTFKNLQYLIFKYNPVETCIVDSRITSTQLKMLYLDHISLQPIWSKGKCLDLFDHLGQLQFLSLTNNGIRTLPFSIFKGLKSIKQIDLSSNALTHIQDNVIPPNLQTLNLANNFIIEPQPQIFNSLQVLNLRMNRFHCGPGLKDFVTWIQQTNVTLKGRIDELSCEFPSSLSGVSLINAYAAKGGVE